MNLAVIAAFTAAAVSVLNIAVTAKLTSGSQFRQWQREEARPITARLLALSGEARSTWQQMAATRRELAMDDMSRAKELQAKERNQLDAGAARTEKLSFEAAALRLIATPDTREAAAALVKRHGKIWGELRWDLGYVPGGNEEKELQDLEEALSAKFRADLGLPSRRTWLRRTPRRRRRG